MNSLTKWSVIVGLLIGVGTLATWPTGLARDYIEYWQLVGSNTQWIRLVDFRSLDEIRKRRQLTVREWRIWCTLGKQLGYWSQCPPR